MNRVGRYFVYPVAVMACVLAAPGCASKRYVSQQINGVNQRISQYEKQTNDRIAWLKSKQETDIAQMNQRIAATDQKLAQVNDAMQAANNAAQEAQGTASRAMEEADSSFVNDSAATEKMESNKYRLVDKAD